MHTFGSGVSLWEEADLEGYVFYVLEGSQGVVVGGASAFCSTIHFLQEPALWDPIGYQPAKAHSLKCTVK
jgi:hypothetical protein